MELVMILLCDLHVCFTEHATSSGCTSKPSASSHIDAKPAIPYMLQWCLICRPVFSWQLYVHANIHTHMQPHTHVGWSGLEVSNLAKGDVYNLRPLTNSTYLSRSHVLILQLSQATRCQLVVWDGVHYVFDMFAQLWPALHLSPPRRIFESSQQQCTFNNTIKRGCLCSKCRWYEAFTEAARGSKQGQQLAGNLCF